MRASVPEFKKLQDRRAKLIQEARALSQKAAAEDRDFTSEEEASYAAVNRKINAVNRELDAELALLDAERRREVESVIGQEDGSNLDDSPARRARRPRIGATYAQLFGPPKGGMEGFKSAEEFFRVIDSGMYDPRLRAAQFEGVPSGGGFAVPEPIVMQLLDESMPNEIVRPRAQIEPMTSDTKRIAGFDTLDHSTGSLYGGFTSSWTAEGASPSVKSAKLKMLELHCYKHFLLTQASNELLADGGAFEGDFAEAMVKAVGFFWDRAFLFGTGAGQPLGALSPANPALIVVAKETGQAANTVLAANIYNMFARLPGALVPDAVWLINSDCLPQLLGLTVIVKNVAGTENVGGGAIPLVTAGPNRQLSMLNVPILLTEHAAALSSQSDISLCAFSSYVIGLRAGMSVEKSRDAGFLSDTSYFRSVSRVDGTSKWSGVLKPLKGATQSPFITLGAR